MQLAVALVAAVIGLIVAGSLIPQVSQTAPSSLELWRRAHPSVTSFAAPLGLFDAFSSWFFVGLLATLAVNLLLCTATRLAVLARSRRRLALAGSVALHAGLLVLIAGGIATAGFRFDGTVAATEGQLIDLSQPRYLSLSRGLFDRDGRLPALALQLDSFEPSYEKGTAVRFGSTLSVRREGGRPERQRVDVNRPLSLGDVLITHSDYGYSPLIGVAREGTTVIQGYVALRSLNSPAGRVHEDFLAGGGLPGRLLLTVYPDFSTAKGRFFSRTDLPRNPVLQARLFDAGGKLVGAKLVKEKAKATVGAYTVSFDDLRYWSAYRVTKDPGRSVVYSGFVLCLLGLILPYVRPPPGSRPPGSLQARAREGEGV